MGCWNQTCGLSHLPIRSGEKVRAFILMPSARDENVNPFKGNGICYSTDVFHPLSFALQAEYNDYGGIENTKIDVNAVEILKFLNAELSKAKVPTRDKKEKLAFAAFDNIETLVNDVIERGETQLALMLVLEDVYLAAVTGYNTTLDQYSENWKFENVLQDLEIAKKVITTSKKTTRTFSRLDFPSRPGAKSHDRNLASALFGGYSDNIVDSTFSMMGHMETIIADKSPTILTDLAHHMQFCCIMNATRRPWIGQAGQGSQSDEYKLHRLIAEGVIAHVAAKKAESYTDVDIENYPEEKTYIDEQF